MKRTSILCLIGASFAVAAWAQAPILVIKGTVPQQAWPDPNMKMENRTVNVLLRLYDRQLGGILLFEEQQPVSVDDAGTFAILVGASTPGGVPARITDSRVSVWGEYVLSGMAVAASAPTERQQITYRKTEDIASNLWVNVPTSTVLCYSCGGAWPVTSGIFRTPYVVNGTYERGPSCSGAPINRTDTIPILCSRD
jgi:hypothetical protein